MRPLSVFMNETHSHRPRERESRPHSHTHTHTHTQSRGIAPTWLARAAKPKRPQVRKPKSSQRARARAPLRGELARHSTHTGTHAHTQPRNSDAGNQSVDSLPPCGAAIFAAHAQSNQSTVCQARRRLPCECRCACASRVVSCGGFCLLISRSLSLSVCPSEKLRASATLSLGFCRGNEVKIRQQVLQSHAHFSM